MPEQNNSSLLGLNAYKKKLYGASSKEEILLSLNKGIYNFLRAAKFSYEQDSLDKMFLFTKKALQIILALKGHFAILKATKDGEILQLYYDWLFKKIVSIQKVNDVEQEFSNVLSTIESFCLTLEEVIAPLKSRQNFPIRADTVV